MVNRKLKKALLTINNRQLVIVENIPVEKFAKNYCKGFSRFEKRSFSNTQKETLPHMAKPGMPFEISAGTGLNFHVYPNCRNAFAAERSCEKPKFENQPARTKNHLVIQVDSVNLPFADRSFDASLAE